MWKIFVCLQKAIRPSVLLAEHLFVKVIVCALIYNEYFYYCNDPVWLTSHHPLYLMDYLEGDIIHNFLWLMTKVHHVKGIKIVLAKFYWISVFFFFKSFFMGHRSQTIIGSGSCSEKVKNCCLICPMKPATNSLHFSPSNLSVISLMCCIQYQIQQLFAKLFIICLSSYFPWSFHSLSVLVIDAFIFHQRLPKGYELSRKRRADGSLFWRQPYIFGTPSLHTIVDTLKQVWAHFVLSQPRKEWNVLYPCTKD